MKPRIEFKRIRKTSIILTVIVIACLVILVTWAVNKIFGYRLEDSMIAVIIAAISLIYEINKSKKLNEAEFLIHLNSLFITNDNYKLIYNLLSTYDFENEPDFNKEISNCDISNYLTLFETFYILLKRKVIDIHLLDDLFAYRFFLAVHNPYIQRKKLAISPKNFRNIYRLERLWLSYRNGCQNNDNYFTESYHLIYRSSFETYLKVFNHKEQQNIIHEMSVSPLDDTLGYTLKKLDQSYEKQVMDMQKEAVKESDAVHKGMLRANSDQMITSCFQSPNETHGIFKEDKLIGFGMLYDPGLDKNEDIKHHLDLHNEREIAAIDDKDIMHIKLVVVHKEHRGNHLQYHMTKYLTSRAKALGKKLLFTTVSPYNVASVKNTFKAGFTYKKSVNKYQDAIRLIYVKHI